MMKVMVRANDERGAISALVVFLFVALLIMAGLVVDGGNAINARARVNDHAEQAARAGANQVDIAELRASGQVVINSDDAKVAARNYLSSQGYGPGQSAVTVDGNEVTVTVSDTVPTDLLLLIDIDDFDVTGRATARAAAGITEEIP